MPSYRGIKKAFPQYPLTISDGSPNPPSLHRNRWQWEEIPTAPIDDRQKQVMELLESGKEVWVRVSTTFGKCRIFVKK